MDNNIFKIKIVDARCLIALILGQSNIGIGQNVDFASNIVARPSPSTFLQYRIKIMVSDIGDRFFNVSSYLCSRQTQTHVTVSLTKSPLNLIHV
jgi:hypothetical protein